MLSHACHRDTYSRRTLPWEGLFTALEAVWCAVVAPGHPFARHSAAALHSQGARRLKGEQGRGSRCAVGGAPAAAAP